METMSQARVRRFLAIQSAVERWICIASFAVMVTAVFADVVLRELRGVGIPGAMGVGVLAMIVTAFVGAGLASAQGSHLRPRLLDRLIPDGLEPLVTRLGEAVTALFCITFALVAADVAVETWRLGDTIQTLAIPVWPGQAALSLVFFSLGLRHALHALVPTVRPDATGAGE